MFDVDLEFQLWGSDTDYTPLISALEWVSASTMWLTCVHNMAVHCLVLMCQYDVAGFFHHSFAAC